MRDLMINLVASVIAGTAVWAAQRLSRYRRLHRRRAFFGLAEGAECLLVVSRHASSPDPNSVSRRDVATLLELSMLVRECGARAVLVLREQPLHGLGLKTEFCVGGPETNSRTVAHLRWLLPGVRAETYQEAPDEVPIWIGDEAYRRVPGRYEYVLLAKVFGPDGGRPIFVLCGQTSHTNHAAAHYLTGNHRRLADRYGADGRFCLMLRIIDPPAYGHNVVEVVRDATDVAFTAPAPPATS